MNLAIGSRILAIGLPRTRIVALGVALITIGLGLPAPSAMAQPVPKAADIQRLAGGYKGTFTYFGPKGDLEGSAFLLLLTNGRPNNGLTGKLILSPSSKHHERSWNCRFEIENLAIDLDDAIPFDKGKTGADGRIASSVEEGVLVFVSSRLPFKNKTLDGNVRIKWEKDGPYFDLTMTVRTEKGDAPQPATRVIFTGTEISP